MYVNAQRSPRAPPYQAATLTRSRTRPGGATTVTRYQARRQGLDEGGHPTPYLGKDRADLFARTEVSWIPARPSQSIFETSLNESDTPSGNASY